MKKITIIVALCLFLVVCLTNITFSKPITFKLHPKGTSYKAVLLDCDHFGKKKIPLRYNGAKKVWTVTIDLPSGSYQYQFLVSESGTGFTNINDPKNKKQKDGKSLLTVP